MQEKESINGSSVQIENFVTRVSAEQLPLMMEFSISTSQPLKILISLFIHGIFINVVQNDSLLLKDISIAQT